MLLESKYLSQELYLSLYSECTEIVKVNTVYKKKLSLKICLLYTSAAADERSSVDLGGRRIIKKKIRKKNKNK